MFHRAASMRQPNSGRTHAGEAFWRFSLAFYARPGVAQALIALQDRSGRDVNLTLFGLWLGVVRGAWLDAAGLTAAEGTIAPIGRGRSAAPIAAGACPSRRLAAPRPRPGRLPLAPAPHRAGIEPEQVEDASQRVVYHLFEALRPGIEGRDRRGDHRAHLGQCC